MNKNQEEFFKAIKNSGLTPPDKIVADGKLHRFRSEAGSTNKNGWYILHLVPKPCGIFGCWKNIPEKQFWFPERSSAQLNSEESTKFKDEINHLKEQWGLEKERVQIEASKKAGNEWLNAEEPGDHVYLQEKGVGSYGLMVQGDRLLVPLRDLSDKLWSLQKILPDGKKNFLSGGKVDSCFHLFGKEPDKVLCVAEGYATAATIHEATGYAVAVAFNAGNLLPVSKQVRDKYPETQLIICADDDWKTEGNPGLTKAKDAALETGAYLAVPDFGESRGNGETDFNDLLRVKGLDAVRTGVVINRLNPQDPKKKTDVANLAALASSWVSEPEPVLPFTKQSPPFPVESLPPLIRDAVTETLDYTQVPIGLACSTALGVAAASVQHLAKVARDHQTNGPVSLYILSVLGSGERKSTIFQKMLRGMWERQKELKENWDYLQTHEDEEISSAMEGNSPPKILFEDATIQGLAMEMEAGTKSVLLSSSEGGTIFGGIGMRGDALMGALAFLNKAWDAEPQSMTRKQAESTYLDYYRLSCVISTQPDSIKDWLSKNYGLAEGMGFLARFLICVPESTIGSRSYKQAPEETPKLDRFTETCLKKLQQKEDLSYPKILNLSSDAYKAWVEYFNLVETEQGKNGKYEYHTSTASKSAEQAARIAGVFTLFTHDDPKVIDLDAMRKGIKIAHWFLDESLKLGGQLSTSRSQNDADKLLEWFKDLENDDSEPLKLGDLLKFGPRPIREKKRRDEAIEILVNLGWIQIRKWKKSNIILLHPSLQ